MGDPIYLDYNATTPIAPEVLAVMLPAERELWGNPSSAHLFGRRAHEALERARGQVAELLGCAPDEVIFTGGGTESDNAAVVGVAEALAQRGRHLVISAIEHAAVENACAYLEGRGFEVTRVGVDPDGRVAAAEVARAIRSDTILVSVMHANNETGVLQPLSEIGRAARARGVLFHTDAAQSVGKLPARVDDLGCDLLTVAAHKLYGPKGTGALYLRRGTPFAPLLCGAGQERGRRSGTESVPQLVGFGAACALAHAEIDFRAVHLQTLSDRLLERLRERIPDLVVHGGRVERLPNTLSVAIPGVAAQLLLSRLDGVATGAGAACHSGTFRPSRVLRAMAVPDDLAVCTLRLTVGRPTTIAEVETAAAEIGDCARARRPLDSRA